MTDRPFPARRATNLDELDAILPALFPRDSRERGLAFRPRPTDVIISPYAKCGTTWLQQMAHGLRTRGSMDFEEITVVTPWIEIAHAMGWDLDAPQVAEPRLYKSHLSWHEVPKGARYIVSFRDPGAAFVSFYRFFGGYMFEPGAITIEELFHWRWPRDALGEIGYWHHLASWWERRHDERVLLLCYEDMQADPATTVRRVADHMDVDLDEELLRLVVRQSSRAFMLANRDRFDEAPFRRRAAALGVLPFEAAADKVTSGPDPRQRLPERLERDLGAIWRERIAPRFDLGSYDALRRALRDLRASRA